MLLNENLVLIGNKVVLVPYKTHHVPKYHDWMQSKELLEKTASERLSLAEEYVMQQKWWKDKDKCTFIILDKFNLKGPVHLCDPKEEISSMVGDVNFFVMYNEPEKVELEVMIAEEASRRKGFGKESIKLMIYFAITYTCVKDFIVKISSLNNESEALFEGLGFKKIAFSEVFQETTFSMSSVALKTLLKELDDYAIVDTYRGGTDLQVQPLKNINK